MLGSLPQTLNVNNREYNINTDYRSILRIISAYSDPELQDSEKAYVCLRRVFGDDFYKIPSSDYEAAIKAANEFIECGERDDRPSPRVVNWEKDEQLLFPAVNKVAGTEVRALPYLHWWTFLGYFQNVDPEGTWGFVLTLRQKKAKGKKLEKYEKEFWNANRLLCAIDRPKDVKSGKNRLDSIFDDLLEEQKEGGQSDGE